MLQPAQTITSGNPIDHSASIQENICLHGFECLGEHRLSGVPEFKFLTDVGEGTYGQVKKALCVRKCTVAIKAVKPEYAEINKEIENLKHIAKVSHPNIIQYYGSFQEMRIFHLVFEFGEENFDHFIERSIRLLNEEHLNNIAFQCIEMIRYLKSRMVFHADFHFFNMQYFKTADVIKLTDFGNSRICSEDPLNNPSNDLSICGRQLGKLQLRMKFKDKSEEVQDANIEFVLAKDLGSLMDNDDIWLLGINPITKIIIAVSTVNDKKDRETVFDMNSNLKPRRRLDSL